MPQRSALVVYGSETGTAQDGAEEVGRMLMRLHFSVQVLELNEVEPSTMLNYSLVVCTISTSGQGDVPINAKSFWKRILRAKLTAAFLASLRFAVFGFGDSSYPKYNFAALKLHKRLIQLGASPLVAIGKGDEQHPEGHESTFLPWMIELKRCILLSFPLPVGQNLIPEDVLLEPPWLLAPDGTSNRAQCINSKKEANLPLSVQRASKSSASQDLDAVVESNIRVTPESHWQDVRHITFSSTSQAKYEAGDVIVIYPHNPKEHVQEMIDLMCWQDAADQKICFVRNSQDLTAGPNAKTPSFSSQSNSTATTLRDLLTRHLDINSIPRRSFFGVIAHFTKDEFQRNRLEEFSNTEYLDELYDYTTRPRRSILEVLQEFDTVRIPWQWAATVFPSLRGRQFSIASGGKLMDGPNSTTRFEVIVAIVKYRTVIRKIRRGVCSRYLEGLSSGTRISTTLQIGGLGITNTDMTRPFVLVGPGTGIAPIRSLLWQRLAWSSQHDRSSLGRCALFFGCRNEDADFFFKDDWKYLKDEMPLEVYPAFSRDQTQKQYVQDLITHNSKTLYEIICLEQGIIFVCGSSGKMPLAVRAAIKGAIVKESSMSEADAESYMIMMEKNGRYKQETW